MGRVLKFVLFLLITFGLSSYAIAQIDVYIFWGEGCPYCEQQKEHLNNLQEKYNFNVKNLEVYNNRENQKLMQDFANAYDTQFNGVPVTVIGKDYVIGARKSKAEELLQKHTEKDEYTDPYKFVTGETNDEEESKNTKQEISENTDTKEKDDSEETDNKETTDNSKDEVVVKVNGEEITAGDIAEIQETAQMQGGQLSKADVAEQLVMTKLLIQEAKKEDYTVSDEEIEQIKQELENQLEMQGMSKKDLEEKTGISFERLIEKQKENVLIDKFLKNQIDKDEIPEVSDEEVEQAYEQYQAMEDQQEREVTKTEIKQMLEDRAHQQATMSLIEGLKEKAEIKYLKDFKNSKSEKQQIDDEEDSESAVDSATIDDQENAEKRQNTNNDNQQNKNNPKEIEIIVFYGEGCPYCEKQLEYLNKIKDKYNLKIIDYEVYNNSENQKLFKKYGEKFNTDFNGVPVTIIDDNVVKGFDKEHTLKLIKDCAENCVEKKKEDCDCDQNVTTSIFGKTISMKEYGRLGFGVILGIVDGINPCVLGVLVFLLTYLVSIGSKKKLLIAGTIFTVTTFLFYFIAMLLIHYALFKVSFIYSYIGSVKIGIGILGLILGTIAIKDFLGYTWGPSLGIPKKVKPAIIYIAQKGTYASAFVLAFFASLVELPCTIGIPMMYVGAIGKDVNSILAIFIYNLFYIIPVFLVILSIYFGFDKIKKGDKKVGITEDKKRKYMKLLSGVVLIFIGILFIFGII